MSNVLIAHSNMEYSVKFMNELSKENPAARVMGITTEGREALNILNNNDNIDIVVLDYDFKDISGEEIINNINKKEQFQNSIIILSDNEEKIRKNENITKKGMVHSIFSKNETLENIIPTLNTISETVEKHSRDAINLRNRITEEVKRLGFDTSYKGTHYIISAVEYMISNPTKKLEKMESQLYPLIGDLYNNSAHNVKCNMNRATTMMYCNCEASKLQEYFCLDLDIRPKVKVVINTLVNNLS